MKRRLISILAILGLSVGLLAGCGGTKEHSIAEDGVRAYVGGNLFESSLDPIKGAMSYGYPFISNALVKVAPDSSYVGDLAKEWTISEDGLTYEFQLKEGITFSDGSAFDAEDVVFTYEMVKEHQAYNENVDLTRLDQVIAEGSNKVVFQLKEAYSPFLDTVAMLQMVPSDNYDSETFDTMPIGTGAYKVAQYDANQQIILQANENYFEGAPEIKKVTILCMDQEAAFSAAKAGSLDIVMVGSSYVAQEVENMHLERFETMDVRNISLPIKPVQTVVDKEGKEVTVGNAVTSDLAVRKALNMGINREEIIQHAFHGVGIPADSFTSNLMWAQVDEIVDNKPEEAKQLLEEAGWKDLDGDGIREKNGQSCTFDLYAPGGDEDRYQLAVAFSENAKELGIDVVVKTATWDEVYTLQNTAGIVWGWGQYSPTVLYSLFDSSLFLSGGYDNVVGYSNPQVDAEIKKAMDGTKEEEIIAAWKNVQSIAKEEAPYLYLVNIEHCYFISDELDISKDTQIPHPHGHGSPIICNMKDWTIKK